jgi:hypothetical protein
LWQEIGRLEIDSGLCLAWDPFHHEPDDGQIFDIAPGTYDCEGFFTESDFLGVRILKIL